MTNEIQVGDFVEIASNFTPKRFGYVKEILSNGNAVVRETLNGAETHRKLINLKKAS